VRNFARTTARGVAAITIAGLALGMTACGTDGGVNVGVDKDGNVKASVDTPSVVESALDATKPPTVDEQKVAKGTLLPLYNKVGGTTQVNTDTPKGGDTIEPLCQQTVNGNKWYGLLVTKRNYKASLGGVVHFNQEGQGVGYTLGDKLHFPQADWAAKVGVKLPDCKHFTMDGLIKKQ
jgi:hypothetical protein